MTVETTLSVFYEQSEPHFRERLPVVCPRKPNFIEGWQLDLIPDGDIPGNVFDCFKRATSDGLVYIVDLNVSRPE